MSKLVVKEGWAALTPDNRFITADRYPNDSVYGAIIKNPILFETMSKALYAKSLFKTYVQDSITFYENALADSKLLKYNASPYKKQLTKYKNYLMLDIRIAHIRYTKETTVKLELI